MTAPDDGGPTDGSTGDRRDRGRYVDAEHDDDALDASPDEPEPSSYVDAELDDEAVDHDPREGHYTDAQLEDETVDHDPAPGRYVDHDDGSGDPGETRPL